jgi:hypothetical protein
LSDLHYNSVGSADGAIKHKGDENGSIHEKIWATESAGPGLKGFSEQGNTIRIILNRIFAP